MDLVNFFVLGKIENINKVLQAAAEENFFGKKYSWTAITKVNLSTNFKKIIFKILKMCVYFVGSYW